MDKVFEKRRIECLTEIINVAKLLTVSIDMVQDKKGKEYLICDGQKIDVTGTSPKGVRKEFYTYLFLKEFGDEPISSFDKQTRSYLTKTWIK